MLMASPSLRRERGHASTQREQPLHSSNAMSQRNVFFGLVSIVGSPVILSWKTDINYNIHADAHKVNSFSAPFRDYFGSFRAKKDCDVPAPDGVRTAPNSSRASVSAWSDFGCVPRLSLFLLTITSSNRRFSPFFATFQAFFGIFDVSGLKFPETRLYYFLIILPVGVMVAQVILVHLV